MSIYSKKYTLRYWLAICICIMSATATMAQIDQPYRYERSYKGSDDNYTVIPLKAEGLALVKHKDKYNNSKRASEIILLDTTLQEKKVLEFEVDYRNNLVGYEHVNGHIYLLYNKGDNNKNIFQLIHFTTLAEEVARYDIKPELDFKLTHFNKVGGNIVLGGYVSKDPVVLIFNPTTGLIKVVPGFFQKDNELADMRTNQNQTFNALEIDRSIKGEKKIMFRTFDENGELLLEDVIPFDHNKSPQVAIATALEREELMAMGTWGERQSKQATGFFVLAVDPFKDQKVVYMDFTKLNHYFDYMKPSRAKRIKENAQRDIKAGKNPSFVDYVMPYKIIEHKDGFLLFMEVYNPIITNPINNYPYGGNPMYGGGGYSPYFYNPYMPYYYNPYRMNRPYYNNYNNNVKNPDEIQTTQSVLMAIDENGKLLWDQSLKIDEVKHTSLEQVSEFYYKNPKVVLMYKQNDKELKIKSINLENDSTSEVIEKIKLMDPLDDLRSERQESTLRQWYGNSFYIYGYQTIRNVNKEEKVRDVFYINKIVVK